MPCRSGSAISIHYDDYDYVKDCLTFDVVQGNIPDRAYRMNWYNGLVYHPSEWSAGDPGR